MTVLSYDDSKPFRISPEEKRVLLESIAQAGLDMRVREHQLSGHDSGVRSAPAFFVNGRRVHSSQGTRALTSAVEAALRG